MSLSGCFSPSRHSWEFGPLVLLYIAVGLIPTGIALTLFFTYPVFTALLSWYFFGDCPTYSGLWIMGLILLGGILTLPHQNFGVTQSSRGVILAIALGFFMWLLGGQLRQWLHLRRLARLHPLDRLYQKMLLHLQEQGHPKSAAQTPREYAHTLQEHLNSAQMEIIEEISQAYEAWHYGQQSQNVPYLERQLQILVRSWARQKMLKLTPHLVSLNIRKTP